MSLFSGLSKPLAAISPGQFSLAYSGNQTLSRIGDPMDLLGQQAKMTRNDIRDIQTGSARDSIAAQEAMRKQIEELYGPYREYSGERLPDYIAMTTGGNADIATSPTYDLETERGMRAIRRAMASRGLLRSSARGASLADFLLQSGQNEAARQYGRELDVQKLGTGAIDAIGGAGRTAGSNVGATYGNLGTNLNTAIQNYGLQRQQTANQGAQALYGLSQYLQQR